MSSAVATLAGFLATVLVHSSLWVAAAWLVERALRSAVWRARLWRGAALGGAASAALALALDTSRLEWRWEPARAVAGRTIALDAPADAISVALGAGLPSGAGAPAPAAASTASAAPEAALWTWTELALGLWALGAALALARLARDRQRLARALRTRRGLHDADWNADLRELARRAGLRRAPRLSLAEGLASPLALARGEIVVPARALSELARDEQRALLAHELAHLARRDPQWLLALSLLERVFWFQPLLRTASRRAGAAAELCCDEAAARWTGTALALARCLAAVATWVGARAGERVAVAMAARGSALVERVERLLAPPPVARFQGALCVTSGALLLAALACSGPTAGEREGERAEQARVLETMEVLRRRIDPDGTMELRLEWLGGDRIEISLPPETVRQTAADARIEDALRLVGSCPEARIAFHVPFVDGAYGTTMTAPQSGEHALELRGDGSIWCGEMALLPPGSHDWRLVERHLEEIARCAGNSTLYLISPERVVVIEGFELRIEDGASQDILLLVLESCARDAVRMRSFRLTRVGDGATSAAIALRLPSDGAEAAPVDALAVHLRVVAESESTRRVETELVGAGAVEAFRTDSLEALALELARLRAAAQRFGTAVVDSRPGLRYGDVAPVLEALIEAGFTDIRFAGCR